MAPTLKVEPPIQKNIISLEAIRVYDTQNMTELDLTTERGDEVKIFAKSTARKEGEIELVFLGQPRKEKLCYYKKHPSEWQTWGSMILTIEQARELAFFLLSIPTNNEYQDFLDDERRLEAQEMKKTALEELNRRRP